jgi:hypothetical protein
LPGESSIVLLLRRVTIFLFVEFIVLVKYIHNDGELIDSEDSTKKMGRKTFIAPERVKGCIYSSRFYGEQVIFLFLSKAKGKEQSQFYFFLGGGWLFENYLL